MVKKLINFLPVGLFSVIATAVVAYVLLSPASSLPGGWLGLFKFKNGDKVFHVLLFFCLNLAYLYDYTKLRSPHHTRIHKELALTMAACTIGLLSEAAQLAMNLGRTFDILDIVADVVGAFLALAIMHFWGAHVLRKYIFNVRRRRRHHRHRHHNS